MAEIEIEKVLAQARRVSDSAEIIVSEGKTVDISAESGSISEVSEESHFGFGIRVVRKGRIGFSFGNRPEKAQAVLSKACDNSKIGGALSSLPGKKRHPKVEGLFDRKIPDISGKELIERARLIISGVKGAKARPVYAGASASFGKTTIANTNGVFAELEGTVSSGGCYAASGESTGFEGKSSRKDILDYFSFGKIAGKRAIEGRMQKSFGTKKSARILLHPYAVEGLLSSAILPAFDGEAVYRGNSFLGGKMGERVFSENISIEDNGMLPGETGSSPFDSEGVPCQRTVLVEKGVVKNFLYNWETAKRSKTASTGNGERGFSSIPKISETNVVISPGLELESALAKDSEISILWFSGTHTVNPFSGEFSVEAKGSFAMKKGERAFATKPGIVSGNIFELLKTIEFARDKIERSGSFITPPALVVADFVS